MSGKENNKILGVNITRSLGLDVGDKRIGLALSDTEGILASPLTIIDRGDEKTTMKAIVDIIERNHVGSVIVGLPFKMDGSIGRQAEKTQDFAEELIRRIEIPVEYRDERLSTVSAKRMMKGIKKPGSIKHDAIAAALVLQGYLDEARQEIEGNASPIS